VWFAAKVEGVNKMRPTSITSWTFFFIIIPLARTRATLPTIMARTSGILAEMRRKQAEQKPEAGSLNESHTIPSISHPSNPRTLSELAVLQASTQLREKDDWRRKIRDEQIRNRWKHEAQSEDFTEAMAEYLVDELEYEAGRWHDEQLGIESTGIPGVVRSDRLLPAEQVEQLVALSTELEDSEDKDWHPGSKETVLDVVHPSMYPLVDGHTRVLGEDQEIFFSDSGRDLTKYFDSVPGIFAASEEEQNFKFTGSPWERPTLLHTCQWLPTDFQVDEDGKVRCLSYINNLHPDLTRPSGQLYDLLEQTLASFVPMFEATLAESQGTGIRKEFRNGSRDPFWLDESWDPPEVQDWPAEVVATEDMDVEYLTTDGEHDWDKAEDRLEEARQEYWKENRTWVPIEVQKFEPEETARLSLKKRRLQVIVKLATIHLTPDKPEYEGGTWHVEGTHREEICATGILYFDQQNISESKLGFRAAIDEHKAVVDFQYEQNEFDNINDLYGFNTESERSQFLGSIITKHGRALAFPNGLQHQVSPFRLADATKPGYRKILAFFLVNPLKKVISTARVPPQRYDWMQSALEQVAAALPDRLPAEVRLLIARYALPAAVVPLDRPSAAAEENPASTSGSATKKQKLDPKEEDGAQRCGMSLEEARGYRDKLMEERSMQTSHLEDLNGRGFSFCEH